MVKAKVWLATASALASLALAVPQAGAAELLTNGGFEAGFTGWTVTDEPLSSGSWFIQSGTGSPINGFGVAPPPEGAFAAMTDQSGAGSHVLTQSFVATANAAATLSFLLYINNQNGTFVTPDTLDVFSSGANQQFRADIITSGGDVFTVLPADVLQNLYQTQVGDAAVSGYDLVSVDVSSILNAHVGETLLVRFAEADNQFFFAAGVDNVSLNATPEPGTLALLGLGLLGFGLRRRAA